jgi:hypothetical protein
MDTIPPFLDHLVLATPDLAAAAPDPGRVRLLLTAVGTALPLHEGPVALSFVLGAPNGPVAFG